MKSIKDKKILLTLVILCLLGVSFDATAKYKVTCYPCPQEGSGLIIKIYTVLNDEDGFFITSGYSFIGPENTQWSNYDPQTSALGPTTVTNKPQGDVYKNEWFVSADNDGKFFIYLRASTWPDYVIARNKAIEKARDLQKKNFGVLFK